jgi:subtilisin-like proprotein convertase family protein
MLHRSITPWRRRGSTAAAVLAVLAVGAVPALAKKAPDHAARPAKAAAGEVREIEAARAFERSGDLALQFGQDTGLLRHVYRRTPAGFASKAVAPRQVAEAFLAEHAGLLGLDAAEVRLGSEKPSPSGTHFRYDQYVGEVPVYRAEVVVKVAHDGQLSSLHSTLRPAVAKLATDPGLDAATAMAIGRDAVGPTGRPLGDDTVTLQVVELETGPHLVWLVNIMNDAPLGDWLVFVDAKTGDLLRVEDRMVYATGSGRVFDPDPRTATNDASLIDSNDSDAAVPFPASYADRTLLDITQAGPNYTLSGPYAQCLDFESPAGAPVTSTDPNGFFFQRSAQGFEDVNVYFHLDQNQRYIQSLGFNNVNNRVQIVDSHGLNGADNAHYVIGSQRLAFGEGGVDDAEDADVILHEYGHSIQHNIVPGWGGGHEGAMGEGFGDYWAGSYSYAVNPTFQPRWMFTWDGHNAFWPGRMLVDSTLSYPANCCGGVHASGTLWCSGATDVMRRIGRGVMDRLMLDHHFALGTSATMADAANQVIQSDLDLYGGAHLTTIVQVFDFWGFVDAEDFVPTVAHTPLGDTNDTTGPYTVTASIQSAQPLDPNGLDVFWGIGAFTDSVALTSTGPNTYAADIPGPLTGVVVRYYIRARDVNGGTTVQPAGAPATFYSFHVGPNNGALSGRVRLHGESDHSGATVTLQPGGASTVTDILGDYEIANLYADAYEITVEKDGFATSVRPGVAVAVATESEHNDFVLFPALTALGCANPNQAIAEGAFGISNNQTITAAWAVQGVEVDVNILHPNIGDLTVELRHGLKAVRLHNLGGGAADNIIGTYPTTLPVSGPGSLDDFIGDPSNGIWTLRIVDANANGSNGVLASWCIRLQGPSNIPSDAGPAEGEIAALWVSEPNPAPGGRTAIRFALPRQGPATLALFDVAGRRVRTLLDGAVGAGRHESIWDGRDADGNPVPAGVYFYRLVTADVNLTRKLVVSR